MRTTIRIDDELHRTVRERALRSGRTVGEIIEDALRQAMHRDTTGPSVTPLPTVKGSGLLPGIDVSDNAALRSAMDEDAGLHALR